LRDIWPTGENSWSVGMRGEAPKVDAESVMGGEVGRGVVGT
jgi:hypothetical protein